MSVRLTNDARDKIIAAAMEKSGFPKRLEEARANVEKIKMECLIAAFGGLKPYRRLVDRFNTIEEKIKALKDEGILARSSRDYSTWNADKMNLAGMTVSYPKHSVLSLPEFEGLRFIRKSNNDKPTLLADNPLVQKFLDAEKVVEELDSSAKGIKANVKAVVYSVNSTKRLVEVWPEAAELIPSEIEVVRAAVPAINFESLNASIGIPSEKK
ncbi:hypothetical protein PJM40_0055 [Salmonella phage vB_SenP_UTK0002]|uniref:Nucleotide modification associated domain-containing protein n=1 Tax=Salmonella phage FSL SP-076 TaxID=1173762 RepID=S4TNU7_9CAUD|nr:hypothetical protein SP076_00165 [Salmonella phage FSL SP-076]AGF88364.1 hypothetical protein SP076_00165 [Salmonella phage FSL SP-076]WDR22554.1 hypothetical protein PJM40_0055 [Salmonella phage vB_SenP_UTK0002]